MKMILSLSSTKNIRYASETKMSWKVNIFIVSFKPKAFFSFYSIINKQITVISIIIQTQAKCLACFTKINTKFKLPSIPKVGSSPTTKNYSSDCQQEMMNYYQCQKL